MRARAPIGLNDIQLATVMAGARNIPVALRTEYLQLVALALRGQPFNDRSVAIAAGDAMRMVVTNHHHKEAS